MLKAKREDGRLVISFSGTIDSSNAPSVERELRELYSAQPCGSVELDCDRLEYITSAGLAELLPRVDTLVF